jgi:SPP1 family predicted phage head-tail adaptor
MIVRAGEFREKVEIWEPTERVDPRGQTKTEYVPWKTRPASVESLSGYETLKAQQVGLQITHRIRMRWTRGLTSAHRILHRDRFHDIVGLQELDQRQVHELICEQVSEGGS